MSLKERNTTQAQKLLNTLKLDKENRELVGQVSTLTEQLEFLTAELKLKSDFNGNNFGKLEERIQELTAERNALRKPKVSFQEKKGNFSEKSFKIGLVLLSSLCKKHQFSQVQSVFNNWKFWIYKKSKLQEEIELKVCFI